MSTLTLTARAPEWYRSIALYDPDRPACEIDLSDNTNLWGSPPTATALVHNAATQLLSRYPAPYTHALKTALADYCGVSPDWIVPGCGSDDVLDATFRTFSRPGDPIAYVDPGFAFIPTLSAVLGLNADAVPLTAELDIDCVALLRSDYRVIYLAAPNNPTGAEVSVRSLRALCRESRGIVVIDQAYAEFSDHCDDVFALLQEFPDRVVVARTLSKAFGLAGLRVGYVVAHPQLARDIQKTRGPYKVGMLAERTAIAALQADLSWVRDRIADMRSERARLTEALESSGLSPLPSAANFVLVPLVNPKQVTIRLREYGVSVRAFENLPCVGGAIRITVGPWPMMSRCLDALREVVTCV